MLTGTAVRVAFQQPVARDPGNHRVADQATLLTLLRDAWATSTGPRSLADMDSATRRAPADRCPARRGVYARPAYSRVRI
jgi:hypothetical protein